MARCLSTCGGQRLDFESETLVPIPYHLAQITSGQNRANPQPGDPAPALNGDPRLAIAYSLQAQWSEGMGPHAREVAITKALDSHGANPDCNQGGTVVLQPVAGAAGSATQQDAESGLLIPVGSFNAKAGGDMRGLPANVRPVAGTVNGKNPPAVFGAGVRRLTPRECERLQGYPDDWTRYGNNEKGATYELKDSPRYRMIGNGVTKTVAGWIGRRIAAALAPT